LDVEIGRMERDLPVVALRDAFEPEHVSAAVPWVSRSGLERRRHRDVRLERARDRAALLRPFGRGLELLGGGVRNARAHVEVDFGDRPTRIELLEVRGGLGA